MTFGALAAWQAWALVAAAAALGVWLFLLKVRPPKILVPSLTLWRRVLDETRDVTWWERIRKAVSLAIAILVTLALALAFVRPSRPTPSAAAGARVGGAANGRVLIVLDSSWSMLAKTSGGESRWERAAAQARRIAGAAGGNEIALATTAEGLIEGPTSDVSLIDAALDRTAPSGGAAVAWPRVAGIETAHFITDGAVPHTLEAGVTTHSVFDPAPNVAITAFDVRPSAELESAGSAYLEIANYAAAPQSVHILLTRGATAIYDKSIDFAAGEAVRQTVQLPRDGDPRLVVRIDAKANALDIDDSASAWVHDAEPINVVVVSDQPGPLRALLLADPSLRATFVPTTAYRAGQEDVVVFDRWAPATQPATPALYFAPPPTTWIGSPQPAEDHPHVARVSEHPVLRGVDPFGLGVDHARAYVGGTLAVVAASDKGTPVFYIGQTAIRRTAVATFALSDSVLPASPAFPILIGNAVEWLARPAIEPHALGLAAFDPATERLTGPDGKTLKLTRIGDSAIASLRATGLYRVEGGGAHSVFAVNATDPQASNLLRTTLSSSSTTTATGRSGKPWWLFFAAAALVLLAGEWWTWQRRVTV